MKLIIIEPLIRLLITPPKYNKDRIKTIKRVILFIQVNLKFINTKRLLNLYIFNSYILNEL